MSSKYDEGLEVRRAVLGAEIVDRMLEQATDFDMPMQELVTEYCWGSVWTREDLSRQTRSLLNIAMLAVLNKQHELAAHVRGALNNGCTPEEIREVCLQVAIYGGVPAGVEAFRTAKGALAAGTQE